MTTCEVEIRAADHPPVVQRNANLARGRFAVKLDLHNRDVGVGAMGCVCCRRSTCDMRCAGLANERAHMHGKHDGFVVVTRLL